MKTKKIAVIGAGASGIACAIEAARTAEKENKNVEITVFEHLQKPLKKILVTGNGRCNFSNTVITAENYHGNGRLIENLLNSPFGDDIPFFESMGVLSCAEDGRIYPRSMQAGSVRDALLYEAQTLGVNILTETAVTSLKKSDNEFIINGKFSFDCAVIACGGKASPAQGSDGSLFAIIESLGHSFTETAPALTAFVCSDKRLKDLKGIRTQARLSLFENGAVAGSDTGEIQFTENCISGIPAFMLSHLAAESSQPGLSLDFCPEYGKEELISHLTKQKNLHPDYDAETVLSGIIPRKLGYAVLENAKIPQNSPMNLLGKNKLNDIASALKNMRFNVKGTRPFADAQVMLGGINTAEININTLMSKKLAGLFFCGEILDICGDCGGYNLHAAWVTGRQAAHSAINRLFEKG